MYVCVCMYVCMYVQTQRRLNIQSQVLEWWISACEPQLCVSCTFPVCLCTFRRIQCTLSIAPFSALPERSRWEQRREKVLGKWHGQTERWMVFLWDDSLAAACVPQNHQINRCAATRRTRFPKYLWTSISNLICRLEMQGGVIGLCLKHHKCWSLRLFTWMLQNSMFCVSIKYLLLLPVVSSLWVLLSRVGSTNCCVLLYHSQNVSVWHHVPCPLIFLLVLLYYCQICTPGSVFPTKKDIDYVWVEWNGKFS